MISSYALVFLCIGSVAFAQQPSIDSGLTYLHSSQNSTGSWGGTDSSFTDIIPTTTTVIETLRLLESSASTQQILGRSFLSAQALIETDHIARRALVLAGTTSFVASDQTTLLSIQNRPGGAGFASDNGWGGLTGYGSLVLDTSLALQALSVMHFSDSNVLGPAINYLLSSQNADGGWGFAKGEASQVYDTALVLLALNDFRASFNTDTSLVSGTNFLLSHQNANGSFGSPNGTPFETALALQAMLRFVFDPTKRSTVVNYLISTQAANGSWGNDPYSTALALRTLRETQNRDRHERGDLTAAGFTGRRVRPENRTDRSVLPLRTLFADLNSKNRINFPV